MRNTTIRWTALVAALVLPGLTWAEEVIWRPVAKRPPATAPAELATPVASLGAPVALAPLPRPPAVQVAYTPMPVARTGYVARGQADADPGNPWPPPPPPPVVVDEKKPIITDSSGDIGPPFVPGGVLKSSAEEKSSEIGKPFIPELSTTPRRHTAAQPPDQVPPPSDPNPSVIIDRPITSPSWWDKVRGWCDFGCGSATGRCGFQSDCNFPAMISPVTNPFYFEDPRALTEFRPIFMYQGVPGDANGWKGGDLLFFGTQARLAFSEKFSITLHQLGLFSFNPDQPATPIQDGSGFAEIKLGGKWTFLRDAQTGSAAALGVLFELPFGSGNVLQNTGDLSISPYLSYGQTLWRLPQGWGSLNFMSNLGYSFSIDNKRSEFVYSNWHVNYNVANVFFPLIEMNWLYYTKGGNTPGLNYEGADLINFGSTTRQGKNYFSLAAGARYKFTENVTAGAAVQFPISNEKGLQDYRLTFDLIFRY